MLSVFLVVSFPFTKFNTIFTNCIHYFLYFEVSRETLGYGKMETGVRWAMWWIRMTAWELLKVKDPILSHCKRGWVHVCVCMPACGVYVWVCWDWVSDGKSAVLLTRWDPDYDIGGPVQPSETPGWEWKVGGPNDIVHTRLILVCSLPLLAFHMD